ncbi:hypothetical protein CHS0354_013832 [Potamilus streckersoni]|uniref:Uncharacterized protein n=1 Tax=Potamilus streckersoni TaxID=2493646 RepID=A0AAE0T627_9BIVA|nr:hypothetical protein CHS0354_013832 [Potamilus streckersoni]
MVPWSAMSSTKSRSVSRFGFSHGIPKSSWSMAFCIMKLITIWKKKGDRIHLCLTPVLMAKKFVVPSSILTQHLKNNKIPDLNMMSAEMLKHSGQCLINELTDILNTC